MKIYRIFLKKNKEGVIEDLELVNERFNFLALLFPVLYFLYKKMWKDALTLFVIFLILFAIFSSFNLNYIAAIIQLGISIYCGFEYYEWETKNLIKNGYEYLGRSSGNDEREAKLKFLDTINADYNSNDKLEQKVF